MRTELLSTKENYRNFIQNSTIIATTNTLIIMIIITTRIYLII